jgi:transposase
MLADHNADRKDLFSAHFDKAYLKGLPLSDAERFVLRQLWSQFQAHQDQLLALAKKIKAFAAKAPRREAEARKILKTAPGVGTVTAEVILSELGDVSRFRNAKAVSAYAGLAPVVKQSGGKRSKDLGISKQGSGLLRWALVETAWRLVKTSLRWTIFFSRLRKRCGTKRAIVAVARKYLCVLYAMLKTSTPYRVIPILTEAETKAFKTTCQGLETVSTPEEVVPAETPAPTTKRRTSARRSTPKQTVTT